MFKLSFKNSIGVLIVLVTAIVATFFLLKNLSKKSDYSDSGILKCNKIADSVNIYTDFYGVKHIIAESESDMYFSLGYIHAKDRLWQMDISRRAAEGRLSEILGKDALNFDLLFRTIGISRIAEKIYKELPEKTKNILDSYTSGINFFIDENSKKLPLEFDVLDYKPESWKPQNSIEIIRLVGWEMNIAWYTDVNFGKIVEKLGLEKAKEFFPDYPEDAPFIINSEKKKIDKKIDSVSSDKTAFMLENSYKNLSRLSDNFSKIVFNYKNYFGLNGTGTGSNAWVVDGSKTEKGKPMFANDPHIPLSAPSRWFEVQLTDNSKNLNLSGFGIPGVPGILIGRNNNICWGITNLMNDESDFYISKIDFSSHNHYFIGENSFPLDSVVENISVKGTKDEIELTVYETKFGPVISYLENGTTNSRQKLDFGNKNILSYKWTGFDFSDEIGALHGVAHSDNWNDFKTSLKQYGVPALNFVYADVNNNIGYHSAGIVPIRKNTSESDLSLNFSAMYPSSGEIQWVGRIPFEELPNSYNPKNNFIITANNKPVSDYKYYISNLFESQYRAARIQELITARNNFSAKEFGLIQNDVYSLQAKEFCNYLFDAYKDSIQISTEEINYIDSLKKWDYEFKPTSSLAVVFAFFEIELYKNLYKVQMGDDLFINYLFLNNVAVRNTSKILKQNFSVKNNILRKSFREAIEKLKNKFANTEINKLQWGEIHNVSFNHYLGGVSALGPFLNVGPFESPGYGTTINNVQYSFINAYEKSEFNSSLGPSLRIIFDMSDNSSYLSILPPGQNGQTTNKDYSSQYRLWLTGQYKKVNRLVTDIFNDKPQRLLLIPN